MGGVPPTKHPKWMEIIVAVRRLERKGSLQLG